MILSLMVVMLLFVAGLHHYEVLARHRYTEAEADLQLYQARRWEFATANNMVAPGAHVPFFSVRGGTQPVANGTLVGPALGAHLFNATSEGDWSGIPNCLVPRGQPTGPSPPPLTTEYRILPSAFLGTAPPFAGKEMRQVAGFLPPYAASAGQGSINFDSVEGWGNPGVRESGPPFQAISGQPTVLAAGRSVHVGTFNYGTVYSRNQNHEARPIRIDAGMAVPRVVTELPAPNYEHILVSEIEQRYQAIKANAKGLADRTDFLNRKGMTWNDFYSAFKNKDSSLLLHFLTLRSSFDFPSCAIPKPGIRKEKPDPKDRDWYPLPFPHYTPVLLLTVLSPFPADGHSETEEKELQEKIKAIMDRIKDIKIRIAKVEKYRRMVDGGDAIPSQYDGVPAIPALPGLRAMWDPPPRDEMENVLRMVNDDRQTALRAVQNGHTALLTKADGLHTSIELLAWMADYGPTHFGMDNPWSDTHAIVDEANSKPNDRRSYDDRYIGHVILNFGLLDQLNYKDTSPPELDKQSVGSSRQSISEAQWRTILRVADPGAIRFPAGSTKKVGDSYLQYKLFELLSADTIDGQFNYNRIANRLEEYSNEFAKQKKGLEAEIDQAIDELDALCKDIQQKAASSISMTRNAQPKDATGKFKTTGQPGSCYSRYGYSYDVVWNLVKGAGSGIEGFMKKYCPHYPLVFYGDGDLVLPATIELPENGLAIKSTFTVPQGRTFYYQGDLHVRGDVWLQRGSTLVVTGDLNTHAYPPDKPSEFDWLNPFQPSGRLLMEEGSKLLVGGNLRCEGNHERGSVTACGPANGVHPITAAIFCEGDITLAHGTRTGMSLCDAVAALDARSRKANTDILRPFFASQAPAGGKTSGPFYQRAPFFCMVAPKYVAVALNAAGVPIPVVYPAPSPLEKVTKNAWVSIYSKLARLYSYIDNAYLGENLYLQADWWPSKMHLDKIGVAPVFPKLDPQTVFQTLEDIHIVDPKSSDEMEKIAQEYFVEVFNKALQEFKDRLFAQIASFILPTSAEDWIDEMEAKLHQEEAADENRGKPLIRIGEGISEPINALMTKVEKWQIQLSEQGRQDNFGREVAGLLIYAKHINVGLGSTPPPNVASGMFVATHDINICANYTIGTLYTEHGSINSDPGAHTNFLAYPLFSRASLFLPEPKPKYDEGWMRLLPPEDWIRHLADLRYGKMCPPGTGIDVIGEPSLQTTAEGWQ